MIRVLLLIALILAVRESSAGIRVVYDFVDNHADAKVANALTSGPGPSIAGGVEKKSFTLHPTTGETTATYKVSLPQINPGERLILMFSAGIRDGARTDDPSHPFDGVTFAVRVDGKEGFTCDLRETKWVDGAIDLTSSAGRQVEVVFVTKPNANSNYDWAAFGQPRVLRLASPVPIGNMVGVAKGIVVAESIEPVTVEIKTVEACAGANRSVSFSAEGFAAVQYDLTKSEPVAIRIVANGKADLALYRFDPQLKIVSFGPKNALVFADTPTEFRCVVKNVGEGPLATEEEVTAFSDPAEPGTEDWPMKPAVLKSLMPGEEKTLVYKGIKCSNGSVGAIVSVHGADSLWHGMACKLPPMPPKAKAPEIKRLADGSIVLQNPLFRMVFPKTRDGYAAWMISIPKGSGWQTAATGSFGKVVIPGEQRPAVYNLYPTEAGIAGNASVSFTGKKHIGSSICQFEWTFALDPSQPRVTAASSITAGSPVQILHYSGSMVYAGDGSFGGAKDGGLFPGLEYLLTERSSGRENAGPPHDLRTVPHPNKITIPFMAVRKGGTLVSLEWNPLQKWDGVNDRPAAEFASPNFLDGQENHKLGLFAPSVPEWTMENKEIASKPYRLGARKSLRLSADIIVKASSTSVLDAVDGWVSRHGLPEPPETGKTPEEIAELCNRAYAESSWDPTAKAWKHTNTSAGSWDPMIATYLADQVNHLSPSERSKIEPILDSALDNAKGQFDLDIAMLAGGVEGALKRMANQANGLIASQRADGSWPFMPDEKHAVFGKAGDTSSGHSAIPAQLVVRYAVISGDAKAREAGLKALGYLDTQSRPEGSQTWELQLHVPDILASAYLINCYLYAYHLTDNRKYLDRAIYWAKSGLPFVYLWNAADRPIMRYGTIPVFGVTWFTAQPWFGVCVQWCGLVYADSLLMLSDYDKSQAWEKVAKGILDCGIQQQLYVTENYPADIGMYPDAYSPVKGAEEYHWDLNPRLISRMLPRLFGTDAFPNTYTVTDRRGSRLALTLPLKDVQIRREGNSLVGSFKGVPGATVYGILTGGKPISVSVNKNLPSMDDIEQADEGWKYVPEAKTTVFKFRTVAGNRLEIGLTTEQ